MGHSAGVTEENNTKIDSLFYQLNGQCTQKCICLSKLITSKGGVMVLGNAWGVTVVSTYTLKIA